MIIKSWFCFYNKQSERTYVYILRYQNRWWHIPKKKRKGREERKKEVDNCTMIQLLMKKRISHWLLLSILISISSSIGWRHIGHLFDWSLNAFAHSLHMHWKIPGIKLENKGKDKFYVSTWYKDKHNCFQQTQILCK